MIGLDRTRREVLVGPVVEENGTEALVRLPTAKTSVS
jgi:hypothetical protein